MKTCSRCHITKEYYDFYKSNQSKDGYESWCKKCRIELSRMRYAPKKEAIREDKQSTYQDGLKKCKKCEVFKSVDHFCYHPTHWDRLAHVCKECDSLRIKKIDANYSKQWYIKNKDRKYQKYLEWRKNNPDKSRAIWHRYKSNKLNAEGDFTAEQWQLLVGYYCPAGLCLDCGNARKLTYDHVIPLSKGGSNYIDNIQPLCGSCNSKKSNHNSIDFRPDKGEFARSLIA